MFFAYRVKMLGKKFRNWKVIYYFIRCSKRWTISTKSVLLINKQTHMPTLGEEEYKHFCNWGTSHWTWSPTLIMTTSNFCSPRSTFILYLFNFPCSLSLLFIFVLLCFIAFIAYNNKIPPLKKKWSNSWKENKSRKARWLKFWRMRILY